MITTTFHAYEFNVRAPADKVDYLTMRAKLRAAGLTCFRTSGGGSHYIPDLDGREITLDTRHLFANQWNTTCGRRVFDWAEDYMPSHMDQSIRRGHYLTQTPDMAAIRHDTVACGYCGHKEPAALGNIFCSACLDSEYLKADDLHLLRLRRIDDTSPRPPLSDAERAPLLARFNEAQLRGATDRGRARIAAARTSVETDYNNAVAHAAAKRDAATWVLDHFPGLHANWIYYPHSGRSCFGWRKPLTDAEVSALLEVISEFPGAYTIERQNGDPLDNV